MRRKMRKEIQKGLVETKANDLHLIKFRQGDRFQIQVPRRLLKLWHY